MTEQLCLICEHPRDALCHQYEPFGRYHDFAELPVGQW